MKTRPHVDTNNAGSSYAVTFGEFEAGELWVESPQGNKIVRLKENVYYKGRVRYKSVHLCPWLPLLGGRTPLACDHDEGAE